MALVTYQRLSKLIVLLLTTTTNALTTTTGLTKSSTSLDVIKQLKTTKTLAPYTKKSRTATALVTGGNSGIGFQCVETLALAGLNVILAARDVTAAETLRQQSYFKDAIRVQELDLADLDSVRQCAAALDGETIDILLNNAGVMALPQREETEQGFERQLGVNHIGHHYLTRLLLPQMSNGGRVVTVASEAHKMSGIDMSDLNFARNRVYTPWGAYGQSKLANVLFAKALDDRLKGTESDIMSVSLHPGVIQTNLWRHQNPLFRLVSGLVMDKTVEQGAATSVYCSLVDGAVFKGGEYVSDCRVTLPDDNGQDRDGTLRNRLWDKTESLIRKAGFEIPENLV